jgi:hypothetical protein
VLPVKDFKFTTVVRSTGSQFLFFMKRSPKSWLLCWLCCLDTKRKGIIKRAGMGKEK